jgi:hypothetical protein
VGGWIVVSCSPEGEFLQQFGQFADTAGSLARPKGVAVDVGRRVFVSDGLLAVIEVFGPDGTYVGVIGRRDPNNPAAGSLFEAPSGLSLAGDRLQVIDGIAGLVTLRLVRASGPTRIQRAVGAHSRQLLE